MSTIAKATLARGTICQRARCLGRTASNPQPSKLENIQQRLPVANARGKELIDRVAFRSLAINHTLKTIASAVGLLLFVAALVFVTLAICASIANPIALVFALVGLFAFNSLIGLGVGLYLAEKTLFHSRVASLCWDILRNTRPQQIG